MDFVFLAAGKITSSIWTTILGVMVFVGIKREESEFLIPWLASFGMGVALLGLFCFVLFFTSIGFYGNAACRKQFMIHI